MADLGPSGFPFEIFISRLFKKLGFETEVGLHLQGKCTIHEVDLLAKSKDRLIAGEVKFHNNFDIKSDTKVMLYVHARFMDLQRSNFDGHNPNNLPAEGWLITNTKFTDSTITYADCYGMKLLGWNYPYKENQSLQALIEDNNLEPVTVLTSLEADEKRKLMDEGIVLCRGLKDNFGALVDIGVSETRQQKVVAELNNICTS